MGMLRSAARSPRTVHDVAKSSTSWNWLNTSCLCIDGASLTGLRTMAMKRAGGIVFEDVRGSGARMQVPDRAFADRACGVRHLNEEGFAGIALRIPAKVAVVIEVLRFFRLRHEHGRMHAKEMVQPHRSAFRRTDDEKIRLAHGHGFVRVLANALPRTPVNCRDCRARRTFQYMIPAIVAIAAPVAP